jgi:general secretion pathway protein A
MYQEHWELKLLPFENVPNPTFFYPSPMHEEALSRLTYTVSQGKGAAVIVGGVGCGKTTLSRVLLSRLTDDRYQVATMTNPALEPLDFLQMVMAAFEVNGNHCSSKFAIWDALERQFRINLQQGNGSVLVIDEAQVIENYKTLEELRMLMNLQSDDTFLLNVILLGQPELEERISRSEALFQRVAIRYRLRPFSPSETCQYIKHRLEAAGFNEIPFTRDAARAIVYFTGGNPRVINKLCDRSLLGTYLADQKIVTQKIVREAWEDLH